MSAASDILVVGAGTTGLTLALAAHDHGADVRIVDRRPDPARPSRALIVHPRTLEVLRPLGVIDAILARADVDPEVRLRLGRHTVPVRLGGLDLPDTPYPHLTLVRQMDIERVLIDALSDRGVTIEWGTDVIAIADDASARAMLRTPAGIEEAEVRFIAGCDGPDSAVRQAAGIGWRGGPYREEIVLADLELAGDIDPGSLNAWIGRHGLLLVFPLGERATWRLLATQPAGGTPFPSGQPGPPVPDGELQRLMDEAGFAGQIAEVAWSARYRVQHRLAERFRAGHLFIAGDAAHTWSPATGQGMNTGIQDAVNLGWKLARASTSSDAERLLDSYNAERRPAASRLFRMTHAAFWAEASTSPLPSLLRATAPLGAPLVPPLLGRRRLLDEGLAAMSRLRAGYRDSPLSVEGSPELPGTLRAGDRLPDREACVDGAQRPLHDVIARPGVTVLLHRDATLPAGIQLAPLVAIHRIEDTPGEGLVAVRPDGHVGFTCAAADANQLRSWLALVGFAE